MVQHWEPPASQRCASMVVWAVWCWAAAGLCVLPGLVSQQSLLVHLQPCVRAGCALHFPCRHQRHGHASQAPACLAPAPCLAAQDEGDAAGRRLQDRRRAARIPAPAEPVGGPGSNRAGFEAAGLVSDAQGCGSGPLGTLSGLRWVHADQCSVPVRCRVGCLRLPACLAERHLRLS